MAQAKKQTKALYVDGYILIVPKKNVTAYKKMAQDGKKIWMKHGALDYKECMGEDMNPNMGGMKVLTFPTLIKAKPGDTVWFSYVTYKSKAHRNQVNKKVMKEMEAQAEKYKNLPMPFDMKKMAYGGFKVMVG